MPTALIRQIIAQDIDKVTGKGTFTFVWYGTGSPNVLNNFTVSGVDYPTALAALLADPTAVLFDFGI